MISMNELEISVINKMLFGQGKVLFELRRQLSECHIVSRQMTGVGFFTNFSLINIYNNFFTNCNFKIGDVHGIADNINHGVGFLLYINNGRILMLEGYTYNEPWPQQLVNLKLNYQDTKVRNFDTFI